MAQSLLKLAALDWEVPSFSTLNRRQKHPNVTIPVNKTSSGFHLVVACTGIRCSARVRENEKNEVAYSRQWRKVHLGIDAKTLEIRAIEVMENASAMHRCFHACSARLAPTTPRPAMRPLPYATL